MAECKKNLLKLKLPAEKLFCESFTVNSPMTTPGDSGADRPSGSKTKSYRVSFVRSGKTIAADGQLSMLELAERSGVAIHYECRSGQCGECMVKETTCSDYLSPVMKEFIARQEVLFIATSDKHGDCDCSFRFGKPGFVRVLNDHYLVYPEYRQRRHGQPGQYHLKSAYRHDFCRFFCKHRGSACERQSQTGRTERPVEIPKRAAAGCR